MVVRPGWGSGYVERGNFRVDAASHRPPYRSKSMSVQPPRHTSVRTQNDGGRASPLRRRRTCNYGGASLPRRRCIRTDTSTHTRVPALPCPSNAGGRFGPDREFCARRRPPRRRRGQTDDGRAQMSTTGLGTRCENDGESTSWEKRATSWRKGGRQRVLFARTGSPRLYSPHRSGVRSVGG